MAEESNKFSGKGCLVIVTLILFMINSIKFKKKYLWINTFSRKLINIIIKNDILKIILN